MSSAHMHNSLSVHADHTIMHMSTIQVRACTCKHNQMQCTLESNLCPLSCDAHSTTRISTQITFWGASRPRGGSNDRNLVRIFGRGLLCPTRILRTISYNIDICPPDIYGIPISRYVSARDASPGRSRCTPWGKSRPHVSHTAHMATQSHNRITMQRYMSHTHSISYNRPTGPQACTHIFEK